MDIEKPGSGEQLMPNAVDSKYKQKKLFPSLTEYKAVYPLYAVLLLVIFGMAVAIIIVGIKYDSPYGETKTKDHNSAPCKDDWIWYRGKCYYFSTMKDTWSNSQEFCESHDASLAIIDNKQELEFLFQFKGLENHWIGLRRTDDNKAWTWTNGTLYDESLFRIQRNSPEIIEYVFLNTEDVKSHQWYIKNKWICSDLFSFQPI